MTAFILRGRRELPTESEASSQEFYDQDLQLWMSKATGQPVVLGLVTSPGPTQFGETTLTETQEGTDHPEVASIEASHFREATLAKTAEGANQGPVFSSGPTRFGETTETAAVEGTDQPGRLVLEASPFGETTMTKTAEGTDQREITEGLAASNALDTHF